MKALLKPLVPMHVSCKEHFQLTTSIVDTLSFLHPVCIADSYSFCLVDDIINKCLFLDFTNNTQYLVLFPSSLKFDYITNIFSVIPSLSHTVKIDFVLVHSLNVFL